MGFLMMLITKPATEAWCPRRDSNPHTLRHMDLNHARLPIPPRGQRRRNYSRYFRNLKALICGNMIYFYFVYKLVVTNGSPRLSVFNVKLRWFWEIKTWYKRSAAANSLWIPSQQKFINNNNIPHHFLKTSIWANISTPSPVVKTSSVYCAAPQRNTTLNKLPLHLAYHLMNTKD